MVEIELTASQASSRAAVLDAAEEILAEEGASGLTVSAVMRRAGIARTTFYRLFDGVYEVIAALLESIAAELQASAGDWFLGAPGSPEVVHRNLLAYARAYEPHGRTLDAIRAAASLDKRVDTVWSTAFEAFIAATEAAIRRDQAAGLADPTLDAAKAAQALTYMGEQAAIDLMGRRGGGSPELFADILTEVWSRTLFGARADPL